MENTTNSNRPSMSSDVRRGASPNYSQAFASLRPTPPVSGRSTPLNGGTSNPPSKPATPANDSFSNLVSFTSSGGNKNLSLLEQQKRLEEQRSQNVTGKSSNSNDKLWGGDEQFWNNLGSGRSTPIPPQASLGNGPGIQVARAQNQHIVDEVDDLFAELNSSSSQIKPTQSTSTSTKESTSSPGLLFHNSQPQSKGQRFVADDNDDDDPFGLNELQAKAFATKVPMRSATLSDDDDDLLGLLGEPALKRPRSPPERVVSPTQDADAHPQDRAVAELVDMGFPIEKAREALENTECGTNVQAAVSWLLTQAHTEAKENTKLRDARVNGSGTELESSSRRRGGSGNTRVPRRPDRSWADDDEPPPSRGGNSSQPPGEKDPAQVAAELKTAFLKTAGSLWKQGSKKVQQAYQEFNSDSDSSQPRWMREPDRSAKSESRTQSRTDEAGVARRRRRSSATQKPALVTDEALMLEVDRPPSRRPMRPQEESRFDMSADNSRDHSPAVPSRLRQTLPISPVFAQAQQQQQQQQRPVVPSTRERLSRRAVEEQAAQAYVSSARRRKPAVDKPVSASEPDLLEGSLQGPVPTRPATTAASRPARTVTPPVKVRPSAPTRNVPPISSISLKASHSHREAGNAHFKRGDYPSAHQSYTTSLSHLPATHPITVILLTNQALTALKIGEPKTAINSADKAIGLIGPSKGESESVDLQNGDAAKAMRDYYGKALMRKAEALEQMERWTEAAAVWREAVEGGHGSATSIQGRKRAEKAATPQTTRARPPPSRKPAALASRRSAMDDLSGKSSATHAASAEAVNRLRAANAAADKVDDEKFQLADSVGARVTAWKGGKADNLRALLGSLDAVLWPEAGWKKISMADLVLANKVKIQYMKGIAKVHPDKIPTTATTEQRMIAGAVFSTLNEAWDKFKAENGL